MRYVSTRGKTEPKSFMDILLEGLASDGGLYMPEEYPQLDLKELRGRGYVEVAHAVVGRFAPEIRGRVLQTIIDRTYRAKTFGSREITPLKILEPGLALLQLSNGPTLAFKDVPLQLVGNLMEYALEEKGDELNILGATSGDTGSAAEYAIRGKEGMRVFMLSPYGRMSRFQQMQMYTLDEPNIFNLVVNGTFDDCQAVVKEVNADADFKKKYKLGAVNSINWARIAAQVVYYVWAYLQGTVHDSLKVDFAVPSGNFGNALAAHVARQMGVPIRSIIVATNENDVLYEFFATGIYRVRKGNDVVVTSSPSMDIASASNFERLIFDAVERDAELVCDLWDDLKEKGQFDGRFITPRFGFTWQSGRASEMDVDRTIRNTYERYGVIIDPHTAVAMHVGLECRSDLVARSHDPRVPLIVVETAQPAKFEDAIKRSLGFSAPVPKGYEHMAGLTEHTTRIDPDAAAVKDFIAAHVH
jgi:threonine synthase